MRVVVSSNISNNPSTAFPFNEDVKMGLLVGKPVQLKSPPGLNWAHKRFHKTCLNIFLILELPTQFYALKLFHILFFVDQETFSHYLTTV